MPRRFNTAGPCIEGQHYMVPPEPRLPDAPRLIDQGAFFVVHAPRQTGKSTTLGAICRRLNAEGRYAAVHFSCEEAEPAGDDYGGAELLVLAGLRVNALDALAPEFRPPEPWPDDVRGARIGAALRAWARACPRPLVLVFDEIDALRGDGLRSVLRQLRALYHIRPSPCPHSVILCGLRDVRDYEAASGGDPSRIGTSSPFNVKVESSRVGDFDEAELRALYAQHTEDAGQAFAEEALARAWDVTQGQPWLVNALAREIVEKMRVAPPSPITREHVEEAKERLILARQTHLDSLVKRLHEQPVRRVMEPVLAGEATAADATYDDDVSYVRDLGLVAPDSPLRVANPIYREVIARVLSLAQQDMVTVDQRTFVLADGRLDWRRLLDDFASFWKEHGEVLTRRDAYHEAAAQLVLMAFLQRIANGGGHLEREYGVGRGRIDMLVSWPYPGPDGKRAWQREGVETKVWRPGKRDPLAQGLEQLESYLERLGLDGGTLVLFDRRPEAADIEERTRFESARTPRKGLEVLVMRG
jgi:hypothetical protein